VHRRSAGPSRTGGYVVRNGSSSTTTRSDCHPAAPPFSRVRRLYASIASRHPAGDGAETALPSSQDDHPHVQRPIRRRVPRRPLPDPRRLHGLRRHVTGSAPSTRPNRDGSLDDACSGFTHVADRTVASAPLRTQPLDYAREHRYRGPGHLLGPDSHRQAILNSSLDLHHDELPLFMAPEQSGRTTRKRHAVTTRSGNSQAACRDADEQQSGR
jgi:hypothetical protein